MEFSEEIPVVVKKSEELGRYLIAKRNIKRGGMILTEAPLVAYPRIDQIPEDEMAICIWCYRGVTYEQILQCKLCRWPLCNRVCLKTHYKNPECTVFSENNVMWSRERASLMYLVRAVLLRDTNQNKWNQIMNLACTYGSKDHDRSIMNNEETAKGIRFLETCNFNVSWNEVNKLVRIFEINSFSFNGDATELSNSQHGPQLYDALYYISSFFANSCSPNAEFMKVGDFNLGIFSMTDVKKGELITLAYATEYLSKSTEQRRISIFNDYSFICQCLRCRDPTELGTFYSSLKCPWCKTGWLNPPVSQSKKLYKCNECWYFLPQWLVKRKEKKFTNKARRIQSKNCKVRVGLLGRLISKATSSYGLHPNHQIVLNATEDWLSMVDLNLLLASAPRKTELYKTIVNRAKQLKTIIRTFGMYTDKRWVSMDAIVASAKVRFKFKCKKDLHVVDDFDTLESAYRKLKEILQQLRECSED